jgi:hypothetical protein
MANLNFAALQSLASGPGLWTDAQNVQIACAVALAESDGNPNAHNSTPPDDSYGLWQINMLGSLGPDRRKRFGITSNTQLFDPATNVRAAYIIWKQSGWNAWTTYTSGDYKKKLGPGQDVTAPITDAVKGLDVGASINAIGQTLFKGAAGLVGTLIGITLIVLAVVILLRNQIPVSKLVKKVTS